MRVRKGLVLGLVVGAIGVLLRPTSFGLRLEEELAHPWLFGVRGVIDAPRDVAVVSIDISSAQQMDMDTSTWPPRRRVHAEVIRSLNRLGVSTIVMDIWCGHEREPEDDEDLVRAIAERRNVVLIQRVDRPQASRAAVSTELLQSPLLPLQQSAIALAPFPLPETSLTSFFWPFFETAAGTVPTLPAVALQIHGLPLLGALKLLVHEAGGRDLDELPSPVASVADARQVMQVFRRELSDRTTAARAREQLAATAGRFSAKEAELLRALLKLYAGPDTYYLNFYGPAGQLHTIPFHELMQGTGSGRDLTGAVVFVGTTPSALMTSAEDLDTHPTVYSTADGTDLSGVEIGATAFANLLTDRTLAPINSWASMGTLATVGVLAGLFARVLPGLQAVGAIAVLGVVQGVTAQVMFSAHARLVPLATPVLVQLPLALFVGLLLRYRDIRRQVPIEVDPDAPQLLFNGVCLTADVKGYTRLAERLSPDELHRLLDEYYATLRETVEARHGLVWGRGGDSALCVWKARGAMSEARARLNACLAAIDLRDRIDRFNASHPATQQLVTCIGLDAGPIGLGAVGGELQAVGTPANAASRIEGLNRHLGTRILASTAVVENLPELAVRRLGRFALHGMSDEVDIVEILGVRNSVTEEARRFSERFAECVEWFESGHWAAAAEGFSRLSQDDPADGPAAFLRDVSLRYLADPPPGASPVIRMAAK